MNRHEITSVVLKCVAIYLLVNGILVFPYGIHFTFQYAGFGWAIVLSLLLTLPVSG